MASTVRESMAHRGVGRSRTDILHLVDQTFAGRIQKLLAILKT